MQDLAVKEKEVVHVVSEEQTEAQDQPHDVSGLAHSMMYLGAKALTDILGMVYAM